MPLQLPTGAQLPTPVIFTPEEILSGTRVSNYRFELLDQHEVQIGELTSVVDGSLEWSAFTAVKGGGSMNVSDIGEHIDWLNVRVRPVALLQSVGVEDADEHPLGVFIPAAPVEQWTDTGRSWNVELLDKLSLLDQDIVTDTAGNPVTYVAPAGSNVIITVSSLIAMVGEATPAFDPDPKTLQSNMVWDVGTSLLQIINDLLDASGYQSLWVDGQGQFQVTLYAPPSQRPPVYTGLAPFTKGDTALMSPEWQRDQDIYSVPNRYVAIGQGEGDTEALVAVVTNEDPNSPFSYLNRGRWITHVETGVEATSLADLTSRAQMGLSAASSITSGISVTHVYLPDLILNATVRFVNGDAGLDLLCYVTNTSVSFDTTELCKSELREAIV